MKTTFLLLFCLFTLTVSGQTINFSEASTGSDCGLGNRTLNLTGTDATGRNMYADGPAEVTCTWNNSLSQWEFKAIGQVILFSSFQSTPNPPDKATGNYQEGDYFNTGCVDLANYSIGGSGTQNVLPVELLSFQGQSSKGLIKLTWQTASELNNEKFEVEKSRDGREFQKIGEVEGNGTTLERQEYTFEVENPRNGVSYYRLKQIDFDGQFEYSKVISVNFKGENENIGNFYPNPSKSGIVNLEYTSKNDEEITVSVFDVTGKLVVNQIQSIAGGENNLSFDFSELNTGIYIVKFGNERNPTYRKLIIER